ncbi:hypothetical protein [Ramlibacter sp. WS9]|uniref:hypothetical protein n=1 Tax=Ramlibacter sp. WS9 TaxID=1882741 RepID=UPI001141BE31|nr:hypothetical protein [Ramlibacter sp. WS9]ROZ74945.1 hypothetical protein EEB15_16310 [Ramlibacter sp. WS9]
MSKVQTRQRYSGKHIQFRITIDVDTGPVYEALLQMQPGARSREFGAWGRAGFAQCRGGALWSRDSVPAAAESDPVSAVQSAESNALEAFAFVAPPTTVRKST